MFRGPVDKGRATAGNISRSSLVSVTIHESDARGGNMTKFNWNRDWRIEDPRNHPYPVVERLRTLLADGSEVQEDPRRPGFYEIHDDDSVYYIYASAISRKIYLLASGQKQLASLSFSA